MMRMKVSRYILLILSFLIMCPYFAAARTSSSAEEEKPVDTTPVIENDEEAEPYDEDEFPQWAKDLRRTEIITFGAMPFVTLLAGGGYGAYKYHSGKTDSFPNPLNTNDAFEKKEILQIVGVSAGICVGIGITDLIINYAHRRKAARQKAMQDARDREGITPITPEEARQMLHKKR